MAETRTPRFNLPQWSMGTDSGSRVDFNGAFADIEARAAYDDGTTAASLPGANLVAGRYFRRSYTDGWALYRRGAAAWEWMGGTVAPETIRMRATGDSSVVLGVDQGGDGTRKLTLHGNGDLTTVGSLVATFGAFGADGDAYSAAETGHLYAEAGTGERGLVLRARAADASHLFATREVGGSVITSIDALGRLQQRLATALGGATMPSTSSVAVAPTTSPSDGVTNGLLLYGHDNGDIAVSGKTLLRVQPDNSTDTTPIMLVRRTGIDLGRLPWGTGSGGGAITMAGRATYIRSIGYPDTNDEGLFHVIRADTADPANVGLQRFLFTVGRTTISSTVSRYMTNANTVGTPNLTLFNLAPHGAGFLDLIRQVNSSVFEIKAQWDSDGRLKTGAPWRGATTIRDARQSVRHTCLKTFAAYGSAQTAGQLINPDTSFTYTWPSMTIRSVGTTDLAVTVGAEMMLQAINTPGENATPIGISMQISTDNGVSWGAIGFVENVPLAKGPDVNHRLGGDYSTYNYRTTSLPGGQVFRLRCVVVVAAGEVNVFLRSLNLDVEECCVETYTAA